MLTIFKAVFLLALASMFIVYPLYFFRLSAFGMIIRQEVPAGLTGGFGLSAAFRALMRVKDGKLDGVALSSAALRSHSSVKKLLYLGASLFLIVLFIGLADSY